MSKSLSLKQLKQKIKPLNTNQLKEVSGGHEGDHQITRITCNQGHTHVLIDEA